MVNKSASKKLTVIEKKILVSILERLKMDIIYQRLLLKKKKKKNTIEINNLREIFSSIHSIKNKLRL